MEHEEKAIFTTLCMVFDGCGNILVQNRRSRNWGGVTFPGGHVEQGESFARAAAREVYEETGLTVSNLVLCGTKQFQTDSGARYVVLLYKTGTYSGELRGSEEGEVFWIPRQTLTQYALAADFEKMLPVFEEDALCEFYYYRENGKWRYSII